MLRGNVLQHAAAMAVCGAAVLVGGIPMASAAYNKSACLTGYRASKSAQELVKSGRFHEANDLFETCVQQACGGLAARCAAARDKLAAEMSSIVPLVTDETGAPRVDVQVRVDRELVISRLDGRGLLVDPGLHEVSFSTDEGVFASEKILVAEGQRNRPVAVIMRAPAKSDAPTNRVPTATASISGTPSIAGDKAPRDESTAGGGARHVTIEAAHGEPASGLTRPFPWAIVLGGAGVASLGAGVLLTYWGRKDNSSLSMCSPQCPSSSVDHIRALYVAADVSLGLGAAGLGAAAWLLFTHHSGESNAAPRAAYVVDVAPTGHGAFASLSGAF